MKTKQEKLALCSGCRQHFYNGNNPLGIKECWNLAKAKIVTRYKIYWWAPMDKASNFTEVKVLSCYSDLENGHGHAYLVNIPAHLKSEWDSLKSAERKTLKPLRFSPRKVGQGKPPSNTGEER